MRPALLAAPIALLTSVVAACGSPDPDREPGPQTFEGEAPTLVGAVEVDGDGFDPARLEVDTSEGFELTNAGDEPLRVVGDLDDDREYDTGTMQPGETVVIAFSEEGTVRFTIDGEDEPGLEVVVTLAPEDAAE